MAFKDLIYPFTAWKNIVRETVTIKDPIKEKLGAPRYRGFHLNEMDDCIGCGTCEDVCQNAAIDLVPVDGQKTSESDSGLRPQIDYGRCCWCALCVDVCTTSSLHMSNEFIWVDKDPEVFRFTPGADSMPWDNSKLGYKRADNYNILDLKRKPMDELHADERDHSFIEIVKGFTKEVAIEEAERCLECGICVATCPAHMDIPDYISKIRLDDMQGALEVLYKTNPLPGVCGRVCTHRCEGVCSLSHRGEPIAIRWLKRYIVDSVSKEDYKKYLGDDFIEQVNKKVAIVGAGPAGLTTAYYLAKMGYKITIFEKLPEAGGMMRYGIPSYRLPYDQIDKDVDYIKSLGVEIKTNYYVGAKGNKNLLGLKEEFDAVFVSTGLSQGRHVPGLKNTEHPDVHLSVALLEDITQDKEVPVPKKIVVIGGGNVALDIARSMARKQKVKYGEVNVFVSSLETAENMPADDEEISEGGEEGIKFEPGRSPKEIVLNKDGSIQGLRSVKCTSLFGPDGNFNPQLVEDDIIFMEADMIVESIGQAPDMMFLPEETSKQLEYAGRRIKVNEYYQTNLKWLFVGGDLVQGPDVVTSINNGHKAAVGIDEMLNK